VKISDIRRIAVVGAGSMGHGIGQELAGVRLTPAVSRYLLVLRVPDHDGFGRDAMALEPVRASGVL
jgi:hypothetical protein